MLSLKCLFSNKCFQMHLAALWFCCRLVKGEWVSLGECASARRRWAEARSGCCRVYSDVSYTPKLWKCCQLRLWNLLTSFALKRPLSKQGCLPWSPLSDDRDYPPGSAMGSGCFGVGPIPFNTMGITCYKSFPAGYLHPLEVSKQFIQAPLLPTVVV